jgi:hypothetical protein
VNSTNTTNKSTFKSKITELEDDTFATGHPSDAAKYEKTAKTITNYIQREYNAGTYLAQAIMSGGAVRIDLPAKPKKDEKATGFDQDTNDLQVFAWKEEVTCIIKNNTRIGEGNRRMFAIFIEQCEPAMRTQLKGTKGYDEAYKVQDGVKLLELIRSIMWRVKDHFPNTWAMMKSDKQLYKFFSVGTPPTTSSHRILWGRDPIHPGHVNTKPSTATPYKRKEARETAKEEYLSCLILSGADNKRYARIEIDLENKMTFGTDSYPRTRDTTVALLNNYHVGINNKYKEAPGNKWREELEFIQVSEQTEKKMNKDGQSECFHCGKDDYWAYECPELPDKKKARLQAIRDKGRCAQRQVGQEVDEYDSDSGISLLINNTAIKERHQLDKWKIYLDGCSTYNTIFNKDLLMDVTEGGAYMIGRCNAGTTKTNKTGMLGTIKCWYNQDGITNILSIHVLEKLRYRIRYDTEEGGITPFHTRTTKS